MEAGEGAGCFVVVAPFAAADVKKTGVGEVGVSNAEDGVGGHGFAAGGCKFHTILELLVKGFDGCRWVPGGGHASGVCAKFSLGDIAISTPQVGKHLQGGNISETGGGALEGSNVERWSCLDYLVF